MADWEQMRRGRDRAMRRRLLETLYNSRAFAPMGWYTGKGLVDAVNAASRPGRNIEDEPHAMKLLTDLQNKGLIEIRDARTRELQAYGLIYLDARITDKGAMLIEEAIPPDPGIEDERL